MDSIRDVKTEIMYQPVTEKGTSSEPTINVKDQFRHEEPDSPQIMDPKQMVCMIPMRTTSPTMELKKVWEVQLDSQGTCSLEPVVREDGIYTSANGVTQKFDFDGKELWRVETGGSENTIPIFDEKGNLYVQGGPWLTGISPKGEVLWTTNLGSEDMCGLPIYHDGAIIGVNRDDTVACFDTNGKRLWKTSVKNVQMEQPFVDDKGKIHVNTFAIDSEKRHVVLDTKNRIKTGAPKVETVGLWKLLQTPLVGKNGNIYGIKDEKLQAEDSKGKDLWEMDVPNIHKRTLFETPSSAFVTLGPDDNLYVVAGKRTLICVQPDGKQQWSYTPSDENDYLSWNLAWGKDGTTYISGSDTDGRLYAINPDGTQKWRYADEDGLTQIKVAPDGTIITGGDFDHFRAFNPDTGKKLFELEEEIGCVHDFNVDDKNNIYLITTDGKMMKLQYGLKDKKR